MKKVSVFVVMIAFLFLLAGWAQYLVVNDVEQQLVAATVAPLSAVGCPAADAGVPAWLCTQLSSINTNFSAVRSGVNAVDSTQAYTSLPKAGGTMTGTAKMQNVGLVLGPSPSGVAGENKFVTIQSSDGGTFQAGVNGSQYEMRSNATWPTNYVVYNTVDAGAFPSNFKVYGMVSGIQNTAWIVGNVTIGLSGSYGTTLNVVPASAAFGMSVFRGSISCTNIAAPETLTMNILSTLKDAYNSSNTVNTTGVDISLTSGAPSKTFTTDQMMTIFGGFTAPAWITLPNVGSYSTYSLYTTNVAVKIKSDQASSTAVCYYVQQTQFN